MLAAGAAAAGRPESRRWLVRHLPAAVAFSLVALTVSWIVGVYDVDGWKILVVRGVEGAAMAPVVAVCIASWIERRLAAEARGGDRARRKLPKDVGPIG